MKKVTPTRGEAPARIARLLRGSQFRGQIGRRPEYYTCPLILNAWVLDTQTHLPRGQVLGEGCDCIRVRTGVTVNTGGTHSGGVTQRNVCGGVSGMQPGTMTGATGKHRRWEWGVTATGGDTVQKLCSFAYGGVCDGTGILIRGNSPKQFGARREKERNPPREWVERAYRATLLQELGIASCHLHARLFLLQLNDNRKGVTVQLRSSTGCVNVHSTGWPSTVLLTCPLGEAWVQELGNDDVDTIRVEDARQVHVGGTNTTASLPCL